MYVGTLVGHCDYVCDYVGTLVDYVCDYVGTLVDYVCIFYGGRGVAMSPSARCVHGVSPAVRSPTYISFVTMLGQ